MIDLHSFLFQQGLSPDWPYVESNRMEPHPRLSQTLNLGRALEEADQHYAAKTGEPVGAFSAKIEENAKAQ